MKTTRLTLTLLSLGLLLAAFNSQLSSAFAQGTAFTYQGRLNDGANPAAGIYDLRFTIYDSTNNPGTLIAGPVTNAALAVSNGLFTVALDFGAGAFDGADRWLEIGVRTNGSAADFTPLTPRQPLTATPYALRAANFSGAISDAQLSANVARLDADQTFSGTVNFRGGASNSFAGSFTGSGAGLTNIPVSGLGDGGAIAANLLGSSNATGSDLMHLNRFRSGNTLGKVNGALAQPVVMMNMFGGQGVEPFASLVKNLWQRVPPRGIKGLYFGNWYAPIFTGGAAVANNYDWYQQHGHIPAGGVMTMTNGVQDAAHQWEGNIVQLDYIQQPGASTNFHVEAKLNNGPWTSLAFNGVLNLSADGPVAGISKRWTNAAGPQRTQLRLLNSNAVVRVVGLAPFDETQWGLIAIDHTQGGGMHLQGFLNPFSSPSGMRGSTRTNVVAPIFKAWSPDMWFYTEHTLGPGIWTETLALLHNFLIHVAALTNTDFVFLNNHPDAEVTEETENRYMQANLELYYLLRTNTAWHWNASYFDVNGVMGGRTNALQSGLINDNYDSAGTLKGIAHVAGVLAEWLGADSWGPSRAGQTIIPVGDIRLTDYAAGGLFAYGPIWSYASPSSELSFGSRTVGGGDRWAWRGGSTFAHLNWVNYDKQLFAWTNIFGTESVSFAGTAGGTFSTPAIFTGNGAGLTNLPAANLTGTVLPAALTSVPAANLTGEVPSASLTSVPAGNLSGTIADARLSAHVALLSASQTFTGQNTFTDSVGIGAAVPVTQLHVRSGADTEVSVESTATGGRRWTVQSSGTATPGLEGSFQIIDRSAGASRLTVQTNGNLGIGRHPAANRLEVEGEASRTTAGSWAANSDARIKTGVRTLTNALAALDRVRLVSFRYTDAYRAAHPGIADRVYWNVVAQEFAEVFPDAVKSSGEQLPDASAILQVDTYPLTIYSAAAVQELNRKVEQEAAEITELKATVAELKELVQAMNLKVNGGAK